MRSLTGSEWTLAQQARPGATHFALVGLAEDVQLRFEDDPLATLRLGGTVSSVFVYLVPQEVMNTATPLLRRDSKLGKGLYRHLPSGVAESH